MSCHFRNIISFRLYISNSFAGDMLIKAVYGNKQELDAVGVILGCEMLLFLTNETKD